MNVVSKLPKSSRDAAKKRLHGIWMAETLEAAAAALDLFVASYEAKYPRAAECLAEGQEEMLAFCDLPAGQWRHLRTSNPIESMFATGRQRTSKTKGSVQ